MSKQTKSIGSSESANNFKLERYKFILQEIRSLNENTHKHLALFQALTTAIIGGGLLILANWKKTELSIEAVQTIIRGLYSLLVFITIFVIASTVSGIFSWYDLRAEEVEILDEAVNPGFRKKPRFSNFWRWHETYTILFLVIIVLSVILYTETYLIPTIK